MENSPQCSKTMFNNNYNYRCWNSNHCQKECPEKCARRACTLEGECCHPQCLGSCSAPSSDTSCTACVHYFHLGRCVADCPPGTFRFEDWRCISAELCSKVHLPDSNSFYIHDGECMTECPSGYMPKTLSSMYCKACDGLCDKVCEEKVIDSMDAAQSLKGCTVIQGNLHINIRRGRESTILRFKSNSTMSTRIKLTWQRYPPHGLQRPHQLHRVLQGGVSSPDVRPFQNITEFEGQDGCGSNSWNMVDVELRPDKDSDPGVLLAALKPWTQYAVFVKAITLKVDDKHLSAKSKVVYIRTSPSGEHPFTGTSRHGYLRILISVFLMYFPAPSMPQDVRAYSNSSTQLVVRWSPPIAPNGNQTYYLIPIRIAAVGVGDQDEDPLKPTRPDSDGPEKGHCCPCPKSVEDLEAEAADASYRKVFENFLHNSIFTP
ncbi:hypothetical protein KUCAC02_034110, partial [Chaenocephalus aceratus]